MPRLRRYYEALALELPRSIGADGNRRRKNGGRGNDQGRKPREDRSVVRRSFSAERRGLDPTMKKLIAEFFGTFALVFAGTGAIVTNDVSGGAVSHIGVALTFGLIVLAMIYTLGDISGAHLNPAVTLGFFAARRMPAVEVLPYIVSQCSGAIVASLLLRFLFPTNATLGSTTPAGPALQSFLLEIILTAILMFVVLSVSTGASEKGITAGIAIGAVIGLEALFSGPITD